VELTGLASVTTDRATVHAGERDDAMSRTGRFGGVRVRRVE
jgi:hypothetical protein